MKVRLAAVLCLSATVGTVLAQTPTVTPSGVVNVASYQPAALPGSAIAQGSMFVVFGSSLGPATLVQAGVFPLPTTLSGTSVRVTSGSTAGAAPIFYTSAGQVVAILPSTIAVGSASLTVTYNGATSAAVSFQVAAGAFGIFTGNYGTGPGAITDVNGKVYGFTNAANPGETAVLYGTGLGPVSGNEAAGPLPGDLPNVPVEVWVGQQKANVSYRGRSGCCAALDQISFLIPNVSGCRVPVAVKINNNVSNFATVAVSPAGTRTCSDPGGPSSSDLAKYLQNGATVGVVALSRSAASISVPGFGTITSNVDVGSATFLKYSAAALNIANNPFNAQTIGACTVSWSKGGGSGAPSVDILSKTLDAGASIGVSGPGGSKSMTKTTSGPITAYTGVFSSATGGIPGLGGGGSTAAFLDPGTFSITGPGGPDVGAFTTSLTIGQPLTWSNQAAITSVTRANGVQITWTGGDPTSFVYIGGFSSNGSDANAYSTSFTCIAKVSDGQFNVPPLVTLSLAPSVVVQGAPIGGLFVGTYSTPKSFTAPGLDVGYAVTTVSALKTLAFQ